MVSGNQRGSTPPGWYLIQLCYSQSPATVQENPPALSLLRGFHHDTLHNTKMRGRHTLPQSHTWEVSLCNLPVSQLWCLICFVCRCASELQGKVMVSRDELQRKVTWGDNTAVFCTVERSPSAKLRSTILVVALQKFNCRTWGPSMVWLRTTGVILYSAYIRGHWWVRALWFSCAPLLLSL